MTIANFIDTMRERCKPLRGHIGFPEPDDERIIMAAHRLLSEDSVAKVTLFTTKEKAQSYGKKVGINLSPLAPRITYIDLDSPRERLSRAAEMVKNRELDAVLAGNISTTADVIRAGLGHLGLAPGIKTVSGSFIMHKPQGATYIFADCGVVIAPTVAQLLDIAWESVRTWQLLSPNVPPKVAFLSFSTKGSARHDSQVRIAEASELFRTSYPQILSDGELQFDAAIDPVIAKKKAPDSPIAGNANCFIFPSLEAGNIAYKLTQRLAGFEAYGPILQGLAGAFSDLSRGSTVDDIVKGAYINIIRGRSLVQTDSQVR